ncbi:aldehyde dehydrogenase family domain-containing protein [Ditylenchus destructor]|uniref:Aldehyde dehydrogenase n=1 Tax=Ditylenchus destructor TaxID=166010 RepID=A0AAD4ND36_9BILA|nr:aldehyde dehydrogenase family domain-containing protein [Ditylenchus destructor]
MSFHELVENQRNYFLTGKSASLAHRRTQLLKLRKALTDDQDLLLEAVYKDLRRQKDLSYICEFIPALMEIDYMLDNLKEWTSPTDVQKTFVTMLDKPHIVRQPKGVVLVIGPWNYPLNTLLVPLIAVMAAGNTAIVKPSEIASHTAHALDLVLSKTFDKQYLAVVQGGVDVTTELLNERYDHIMFTGSTPVGRAILRAAEKHLTPCTLELGGKCPTLIEPDADIEITARRLVWGKLLNCGQTCLAPDYVIVHSSVKNKLVDAITRTLHNFYGKHFQSSPDYSRIINTSHFERLESLLERTKAPRLFDGGELDRDDLFIPPFLLDATVQDPIMENEIFGPILPIITTNSFAESLSIVRARERPLALYLFTRDESKVQRVLSETSSGSVTINDVILQLTVDTLPFGGIGHSGMGRYRGKYGFDEFTHEKAVLKRGFFADGIASARYPPLTEKKVAQLHYLTATRRSVPGWMKRSFRAFPCLLIGFLVGLIVNRFHPVV